MKELKMPQRILFIMSMVLNTVKSQELNSSDFDAVFLDDLSDMIPDPVAARRTRGLYGVDTDGLCPPECLCLSEIQVRISSINMIVDINIHRFSATREIWQCSQQICLIWLKISASQTRTSRLSQNMWVKKQKEKSCRVLNVPFHYYSKHVRLHFAGLCGRPNWYKASQRICSSQ